jgi:hypothetical protein
LFAVGDIGRNKESKGLSELTTLSGAALLYMALAMWATQPSDSCQPTEKLRARLDLGRQLDREHLQRDAGKIRQAARRYASGLAVLTSVNDAITECEETLARDLAEAHDVPLDDVRAAISVAP